MTILRSTILSGLTSLVALSGANAATVTVKNKDVTVPDANEFYFVELQTYLDKDQLAAYLQKRNADPNYANNQNTRANRKYMADGKEEYLPIVTKYQITVPDAGATNSSGDGTMPNQLGFIRLFKAKKSDPDALEHGQRVEVCRDGGKLGALPIYPSTSLTVTVMKKGSKIICVTN